MMEGSCDQCMYYEYDEEFDEYGCVMELDEDDAYHVLTRGASQCPYFKAGDEYQVVKHQM
jgi:hypothetical protein